MEATWESSWQTFKDRTGFSDRDEQNVLGTAVFDNLKYGGQLCAEGPTGVGKSFVVLIPAIISFKEKKHRTIITTETLSLLDQLVDNDLPFLQKVFGTFKYFGLKGRNHYLCVNRAGTNHPVVVKTGSKVWDTLGERRDVEHAYGSKIDDDVWSDICGDSEYCSQNRCDDDKCYSTRAKKNALESDIVVTSHAMLQIHGEFMQQDGEGLLGDFTHIIVDEAHSLEKTVVAGSTFEYAPWDIYKKLEDISKGLNKAGVPELYGFFDEMDKKLKESINIIQNLMSYQVGTSMSVDEWGRQCMPLSLVYTNNVSADHLAALDDYEEVLPDLLDSVITLGTKISERLDLEAKGMEKGSKKLLVGSNASKSLCSFFGLIRATTTNKDGVVDAYGTTYAMFADGFVGRDINRNPKKDIIFRAVPLDISNFLRTNLWKNSMSVTLISATLRDMTDGSFRFLKKSLGLESGASECVVGSPFDFEKQQLIYLTDGSHMDDVPDISGARFSESELVSLLKASEGRALVLFTSMVELNYVKNLLESRSDIPWTILSQEKGSDKSELAKVFKEDTHSILLGSNSFVQGFDVPGSALSQVILVKWFNPRFDAVMKAQIRHWRERGFPNFYTMRSMETTVQAFGRGVRSDRCKVVCSLIDNRVSSDTQKVRGSMDHIVSMLYPQSPVTSNISDIHTWLT
jgi:ATP-dependent DNA helicase DinG